VSQIDHNQIDGAMTEVISRAQGEKRVRQLDMVARKRSEESKRIDNLRQQGNLATKRAIISGIEEIKNQPLDSSVGQLSDQYLVDQLTSPPRAEPEDQPTIHDPEINETADLILDQDFLEELPQTPEAISETPDVPEPQMSAPPEPETPKQSHQVPAPKAKQENRPPEDTQNQPKEQPQPQPHTKPKPKKAGGAHRIYGQKLPEEYLVKSNSRKRSLNKRSPRPAKKRVKLNLLENLV
jgi:hypothetical protein